MWLEGSDSTGETHESVERVWGLQGSDERRQEVETQTQRSQEGGWLWQWMLSGSEGPTAQRVLRADHTRVTPWQGCQEPCWEPRDWGSVVREIGGDCEEAAHEAPGHELERTLQTAGNPAGLAVH